MSKNLSILTLILSCFLVAGFGQNSFEGKTSDKKFSKAKGIINKVLEKLGGERYLLVKSSYAKGKFSTLKDGRIASFHSFVDVIVFPDRERTDFTSQGSKTVQVNTGETGWIYEEHFEVLRDQKTKGIDAFKKSLRSHFNYLIRGYWENEAELSYVGRRRESIGKSNDVLKLVFNDGFEVEYEFSDEGIPMKTVYKRFDSEKKEVVEETRYSQFLDEHGLLTPFIIDRYSDGKHVFRVNYESMAYNKRIPEWVFKKPVNPKKLKKKLKL